MSLSYLILGLLSQKPDSGYDLNKRFELTVAHFWTTDQSQIYRTLYKLRDDGYVRVETVQQDSNPDKKVYFITDKGRDYLMEWLADLLEEELVIRDAEVGQVYFGALIGEAGIIHLQRQYISAIREKLDIYREVEKTIFASIPANEKPLYMELAHTTLRYGIGAMELQIRWREDLIQTLENRLTID